MAVQNVSFSAAVDAWVLKSQRRQEMIFRESCQRLVNAAQANVPVDTGFLKSSGLGSVGSPMPMREGAGPETGNNYGWNAAQVITVIAGLKIGQTFFWCYTAAYAAFVEYGTSKMAARGYVRLAVQQWRSIVAQVVAEAKSRVGG